MKEVPEDMKLPENDQDVVIEDDVWIGLRCILTPGRTVRKGSIIAMGSVLTKDFPEYSVVGGNPAKLLKTRTNVEIPDYASLGVCKC